MGHYLLQIVLLPHPGGSVMVGAPAETVNKFTYFKMSKPTGSLIRRSPTSRVKPDQRPSAGDQLGDTAVRGRRSARPNAQRAAFGDGVTKGPNRHEAEISDDP
jgi:hypothetical protein